MTVYLCGGINGLSDADAKDWREAAKQLLHAAGVKTLDPMRRDYRGKEAESASDIVYFDEKDICDSDVILVNAARPSWGTAMEIMYAYQLRQDERPKKRIVAFGAGDRPSPWLVCHCVLYPTVADACRAVIDYGRIKGDR